MSKSDQPKNQKAAAAWRRAGVWMTALLLLAGLSYGANNRLTVTEYTIESAELPLGLDGYRIVQLSDLHNKVFGNENAPLLERVRALHPDMIVVTGDVIDSTTHTNYDQALLFMKQMPEIAPTYYVTGNHEHRLDKDEFQAFWDQSLELGVHCLNNETVQEGKPERGQTFTLIGMDDYSLQANVLGTLVSEAQDDFTILLAHEPQFFHDYYAETGVDLVLSGHAHGGQWRIPFIGQGIYAPDQGLMPKLTAGIVQEQDSTMIISRGLGNSAFPLRVFNHPEIVSVTLRAANGS